MKSIQYYSRSSSARTVSRTVCCWICCRNLILLKASSSLARCLANVSIALLRCCRWTASYVLLPWALIGKTAFWQPAQLGARLSFGCIPQVYYERLKRRNPDSHQSLVCYVTLVAYVLSLDPADVPCCGTAGSTKLESWKQSCYQCIWLLLCY